MNGYDKYPKDINKAIDYFNIASNNGILDATLELFFYYSKKYLSSRDDVDKELLLKYKTIIEGHNKYDDKLRERIEHTLNELSNKKEINIDCLID
jgi:hypothetical protein